MEAKGKEACGKGQRKNGWLKTGKNVHKRKQEEEERGKGGME